MVKDQPKVSEHEGHLVMIKINGLTKAFNFKDKAGADAFW